MKYIYFLFLLLFSACFMPFKFNENRFEIYEEYASNNQQLNKSITGYYIFEEKSEGLILKGIMEFDTSGLFYLGNASVKIDTIYKKDSLKYTTKLRSPSSNYTLNQYKTRKKINENKSIYIRQIYSGIYVLRNDSSIIIEYAVPIPEILRYKTYRIEGKYLGDSIISNKKYNTIDKRFYTVKEVYRKIE